MLAANDFDSHAAQTYRCNHPETAFIPGPIQDIAPTDFLEAADLGQGELDCLIGGPPCQAFSVYNHQRGFHDERSGLFREYIRIVEGVQPKVIVLENVTGILSAGGGRAVEEIHARLSSLGYMMHQATLKAEEFGVPQERRRVFFVGIREPAENFIFPKSVYGTLRRPFVTVDEAIGDLPPLRIREGKETADYGCKSMSAYQRKMRAGASQLFNHVAPNLAKINLERLKHIPQGGSWRDVPVELLPAGMKRARRCDHTKRYGRLHPEGLASTILTKCDLHWGAYIHPTQERTLTVREAARFQSFPDMIRFRGPKIEQFRQVGNAVPPLLAKAVARSVERCLQGLEESGEACQQLTLAV